MRSHEHLLKVTDLRAGYGDMDVLRGASLTVDPGECVLLAGPNGAGKTTFMRAIMGAVQIHGGEVDIFHDSVLKDVTHERAKRGIALVPEGRQLFGPLTVYENIVLGSYSWMGMRRPTAEFRRLQEYVLEVFPALRTRLELPAGSLSGGQQQMVAIARALMAKPKLLLLDEPSIGLAPMAVQQVFNALARLRAEDPSLGILLVEQRIREAVKSADRGYILRSGVIVWEDTLDVLRPTQEMVDAYMGTGGSN